MRRVLIVASSLDGYIAQGRNQVSTAWTSSADKKWFSLISREMGVLIMGRTTFETIGRPLPGRKTIIYTSETGKFLEAKNVKHFSPTDETTNLYVTGKMTLTELMRILAELGAEKVAICGGASVYQQALAENQVDEIYLTLEPVLFGAGVKLLQAEKYESLQVIERVNLSAQTTMFHLAVNQNNQ